MDFTREGQHKSRVSMLSPNRHRGSEQKEHQADTSRDRDEAHGSLENSWAFHIISQSSASFQQPPKSCPALCDFSLSSYQGATKNMVQKQKHKIVSLPSESQKPKVILGDGCERPFSDLLSGQSARRKKKAKTEIQKEREELVLLTDSSSTQTPNGLPSTPYNQFLPHASSSIFLEVE